MIDYEGKWTAGVLSEALVEIRMRPILLGHLCGW